MNGITYKTLCMPVQPFELGTRLNSWRPVNIRLST